MQALWAKVLAGEMNSPGAFSKRTIHALGSLGQGEAYLFRTLCGFIVDLDTSFSFTAQPIIFDSTTDDLVYGAWGINLMSLAALSAAGLIVHKDIGYAIPLNDLPHVRGSYFDGHFTLTPQPHRERPMHISMGEVMLSPVGVELSRICTARPKEGFLDHLAEVWAREGLELVVDVYPSTPF